MRQMINLIVFIYYQSPPGLWRQGVVEQLYIEPS